MAFTRDGRRLIADDGEWRIPIWDTATGALLTQLTGHVGPVVHVVVSADGRRFVSLGHATVAGEDDAVHVWDAGTFAEVRRFVPRDPWEPTRVAASRDGRRVAAVGTVRDARNRGRARAWDVDAGREFRPFPELAGPGRSVAISPDGRTVAAGDETGAVVLFEAATGGVRHRITGHACAVDALAFSPDGRTLAAASLDAPVYIWDLSGRPDADRPPTADELARCWADLASPDAAVAFRAIRRLVNAPAAAVTLLRDRLPPARDVTADRFDALIRQLDSPRFVERQTAARELEAVADRTADRLRTAAAAGSPEVRRAVQAILEREETDRPDVARAVRAVEVLEAVGTPAAREQLRALAGGAAGAALTRAAADAVRR
jgi:peptidoglycan/xylan/chitin deacetylase (PgdA/CDA1 family)